MATFLITLSSANDPSNRDSEEFEAVDAVTAAFHAGVRAASNVVDHNFMVSGYQICELLEDNSVITVTEV